MPIINQLQIKISKSTCGNTLNYRCDLYATATNIAATTTTTIESSQKKFIRNINNATNIIIKNNNNNNNNNNNRIKEKHFY
ncbi:hypothetical protein DOY81_000659 [Sarcophaga bullata]|nr:hypothetical protein DOY81_000659 [Sarcophaga bullata]